MRSRNAVDAFCTALPETNSPALANAPVSKPVRSVSDCTRCIRDGVVPSMRRRDLHMGSRRALAEFDCADRDLVDAVVAQRRPGIGDVVGRRRGLVHASSRYPSRPASRRRAHARWRCAAARRRRGRCTAVRPSSVNVTSSGWSPMASRASPGRIDVAAAQLQRIDVRARARARVIADSTANAGWVMPYPRSAPLGTVLVYTE